MAIRSAERSSKERCAAALARQCIPNQYSKRTRSALLNRPHTANQRATEEDSRVRSSRTVDDSHHGYDHRSLENLSTNIPRDLRGMNFRRLSLVVCRMRCVQDIVDILIGWYIEALPTDRILEYTAEALHKFRPFWIEQIEGTTLTLLDHFIEDADSYALVEGDFPAIMIAYCLCFQQFDSQGVSNEDNTVSFTDKIAALYRYVPRWE